MTAEQELMEELARIDEALPGLGDVELDEALIEATMARVATEPVAANEPPKGPPVRWLFAMAALLMVTIGGVWLTQGDAPNQEVADAYAPEPSVEEDGVVDDPMAGLDLDSVGILDGLDLGVDASRRPPVPRDPRHPPAATGSSSGTPWGADSGSSSGSSASAGASARSYDPRPSMREPSPDPTPGEQSASADSGAGYYGVASPTEARAHRPRSRPRVSRPHPAPTPAPTPPPTGGERYQREEPTRWKSVTEQPLSTLSIDVDTASYTNVRRFLDGGRLPPPDAVRIEELLNWFEYDDHSPKVGDDPPFAVTAEVAPAPWDATLLLARVALRAATLKDSEVPPRNLVFLVDVSGSMSNAAKLPLLQRAMTLLAADLRPEDRMAIVTYSGRSEIALQPTTGEDKGRILAAIDSLHAGGSTNGEGGIRTAYQLARRHFDREGVNRVIMATDGDFNVGISDRGQLIELIEDERRSGVFLTTLGFGTGNLKDDTLEALADHGNGNYAYIDGLEEAHKVLTDGAGKLVTVAKDVKLQVEFNPAKVSGWRLLGYENRVMAAHEFRDDKKDAGEMQAGDGVTALFLLAPVGRDVPEQGLRYQKAPAELTEAARSSELMVVNTRWKQPQGSRASEKSFLVKAPARWHRPTDDFETSAAVAAWGLMLRGDRELDGWTFADAAGLAGKGIGDDPKGQRRELRDLILKSSRLSRR